LTFTAPDVVVYVDANGNPISTGYVNQPAPTPAVPVPAVNVAPVNVPAKPSPVPEAPVPKPAAVSNNYVAPAPVPTPEPAPVVVNDGPAVVTNQKYPAVAAGVSRSNGYGISWTPFKGTQGNVQCKSQAEANDDFTMMAGQQFTTVRIYGVACNQAAIAVRAAQNSGLRVMLGVFDISNTAGETNDMINQVQGSGTGWNLVDSISIGNEDVQNGKSVSDVLNAVATARGILRGAGYEGPIVHVDTSAAILNNRQLCSSDAGDYIAANIHPFFNAAIAPSLAGAFVATEVGLLRICSAATSRKRKDHRVVVTETGWPRGGSSNGLAVPGSAQQFSAIASIKKFVPNDVYLYSAFNNKWLVDNSGTFGAEHFWGLLDY
jgi:exo-beta-1,3-glucanase (GH17 family)